MKILVFGGSGFLGSYLIDEIISRGYSVVNADLNPPKNNIDKQKYLSIDILNKKQVFKTINSSFDCVYNLAGMSDLNESVHNPKRTYELNIIGHIHILEACISNKIKHYIYSSSAYVYSLQGSHYGISKLASEKIIEEYSKSFGLNYTILRYGSLYGERANSKNGIFRILSQALEEGEIQLNGDGSEIREFIHCTDAAKLSVDILNNKYFSKNILLTGQERHSMKDLVLIIEELLNKRLKIKLNSSSNNSHYKLTPYSYIIKEGVKLTSNPFVDLGQGLISCIHEIKKEKW